MFCLAAKCREVHVFAKICMPHAIQIRQTGGSEVLNWTAIDVGEPGAGQVRLAQAAAGLSYIDVYHRTGYYPPALSFIPGLEGAGTVEAVAQDVRGLKVGDRVAYAGPTGVRRAPALAMATSDACAQSGAPMDLYVSALRQLYPPFPTAATLANQSDEYVDVAAELGLERLRVE